MYTLTLIVLAVMVVVYVLASTKLKLSVELSMFVTAIAASIVGGIILPDVNRLELLLPLRHIAEGAATYLDLILIFFFATFFMNIIKESGGLTLMAKAILSVSNIRPLALLLVMVLMLVPGAITGAGSVSVLVAGSTAALVLSR
ncbi:MAG TPA: C4-dicarboxylate ABC transporter, partial [Bacillota bacterium]|nr:C4-dicarboxylate ABC transporter [Bacillota bacterium]